MTAPDWSEAECLKRHVPTRVFFFEEYFPQSSRPWQRAKRLAKSVCAGCAIREGCLTWALETNQEGGVWGGLTYTERKELRRAAYTAAVRQLKAPRDYGHP